MKWILRPLGTCFCSVLVTSTLLKKISSHTLLVTQEGIRLFVMASPTHKLQGGLK